MDLNDFLSKQREYAEIFNEYASARLNRKNDSYPTLFEAMKYCFFSGGKRLRPVIMLAAAEFYGADISRVLPFAFALECVHTYSLIHDDLPAMDNDDLRRGKPTCHKVFGEAMAILAGDALLNLAFSVCSEECFISPDKKTCECAKILSDYAGFEGMAGGQAADVESEKNGVKNAELLYYIEKNKTAKLLTVPFLIPCILAGGDREFASRLCELTGIQFQIVDDILDVVGDLKLLGKTVGKDAASGKLTYVGLFGIEQAKKEVERLHCECLKLLSGASGAEFFISLLHSLKDRVF